MIPVSLMREFKGRRIDVQAYVLDSGLSVLVAGGDKTHIGTVSAAAPGVPLRTITFPGHEEGVISEKWAYFLSVKLGIPVAVSCGIHYDIISRAEIDSVLNLCDGLLIELADIVGNILLKQPKRISGN